MLNEHDFSYLWNFEWFALILVSFVGLPSEPDPLQESPHIRVPGVAIIAMTTIREHTQSPTHDPAYHPLGRVLTLDAGYWKHQRRAAVSDTSGFLWLFVTSADHVMHVIGHIGPFALGSVLDGHRCLVHRAANLVVWSFAPPDNNSIAWRSGFQKMFNLRSGRQTNWSHVVTGFHWLGQTHQGNICGKCLWIEVFVDNNLGNVVQFCCVIRWPALESSELHLDALIGDVDVIPSNSMRG